MVEKVANPVPETQGLLVAIGRALRLSESYSLQHPTSLRCQEQGYACLVSLTENLTPLTVSREETNVLVNGESYHASSDPFITLFSGAMYRRDLDTIQIEPNVLIDDFQALISLLTQPPTELRNTGGPGKFLAEKQADTIWVNGRLPERRGTTSDAEITTQAPELQLSLTQLSGQEGDALQASIRHILEQADGVEKGQRTVFCSHLVHKLTRVLQDARGKETRQTLRRAIAQLADEDIIRLEVAALGERDVGVWQEQARVLEAIGAAAVPTMLDVLANSEDRRERLRLLTTVRFVGARALEPLLAMLDDDRWYVVRNAVDLLGDIAGPEQAEQLRGPLFHKEPRVRAGARVALRKLGSTNALEMILAATKQGNEYERIHAISQMAWFPPDSVVSKLEEMVKKNQPNVADEALRVLFELKKGDMIAFLTTILSERQGLLRRFKYGILRSTATELLCLRLPETWPLLQRYRRDRDRDVRKWVQKAKQRMRSVR